MAEQLWFTKFLNYLLAGPVTAFLRVVHAKPADPTAPIPNSVAMEALVVLFLIAFFVLVRSRLSVDRPGALQHIIESTEKVIQQQSGEIIGSHSEGFTAFLVTLTFFILISNLLGLVPGFESPTATPTVPLGCAIVAFFYYHTQGIKKKGLGHYLAHFFGPSGMPIYIKIPLAILLFPIEIISHCARVLSLTIRLYANMFAGDLVTMVFFSLVPIVIPIVFLGLHIFVSLLQTYIFVLLAMVYLAGAVAEEH